MPAKLINSKPYQCSEKFSVRQKWEEERSEIILYDNTACDGFQHFMPFIKIVRKKRKKSAESCSHNFFSCCGKINYEKPNKGEKKTTAKVSTGSEQQFSCENPSEKLFFPFSRDFNSFRDENIISETTMKICRRILLKTVIIIIIFFFRLMKKVLWAEEKKVLFQL